MFVVPPQYNTIQDAILDVVTSGQLAWDGLRQRVDDPFKSLGTKCLVFGNGDDDVEVREKYTFLRRMASINVVSCHVKCVVGC